MKYNHLMLVTITALLTSACITTNQKVTSSDVEKYQSPKAFLEDQLAQGTFGFTKKHLLEDGTIVYRASFTGMNTRYLRKPAEDAKGYCVVKQGKWSVTRTLGLRIGASGDALARNLGEIERLGAQQGSSADVVVAAKQNLIRQSQAQYQNSGMSGAQRMIDAAEQNGHLGIFKCESTQGSWDVTIRPVSAKLADPRNQLTTHSLIVHVSVINNHP